MSQAEHSLPGSRLAGMAEVAMHAEPDRQAIEYGGRWITYGELGKIGDKVAECVRLSGAEPCAPVAFAPRNRPSALAALLGLIAERRSIRMMYAYQSGEALARNFARIGASILVADKADFSPEVVAQLRALGCAGIGLTEQGAHFVDGLDRVTRATDADAPEAPTFEMLTSGTTGAAKLWPLTYELLEGRFVHGNSVFGDGALAKAPPMLLCYPLCNISGLYSGVPAMVTGMRIVLQERFTLEGWLDHLRRFPAREIYLPPVGVKMLLEADVAKEELGPAAYCRSGMTSLPVEVQRAFEERYGIPILISYGATEFGGVVAQMSLEDIERWGMAAKRGSSGRAWGEAQLRITDPDTREVLPPGREGLLEVLVPSIRPDWSRTSDIARIDEDGFLFVLGRADGAIMRGGFKILPEVVEAALVQHPAVEAAAVGAVADERLGQVPAALIELKPGAERPGDAELEAHVRGHVPATHVPVEWRFVDKIPRTASLKIARHTVRDMLAQMRDD